jgi:RNA polymerase sigma-70 factor (ECF subfamily)
MAVALTPPLDATLVTQLRQGDPDALGLIYDRYGAVAYRVALRTLRDEKLAEDAVQEAFLDLWRRPEVYDPARAPLGSWICVLAHRRAADIARREARRHITAAAVRWEAPDSYTTEELVVLLTDRRRVDRALRALAPHDRRIIELAYHGGLSQAEIANRLDLPLGTVKSRTFKALRRLRSLFEADPSDSAGEGTGLQPLASRDQ